MKAIVLLSAVGIAAAALGGAKTDRLMKSAEGMGFSDVELSRLRAAATRYEDAESELTRIRKAMGIRLNPVKAKVIHAHAVDPTIRQLEAQWKRSKNRFEIMNKTVRKFGPSTNLMARAASATMQQKLDVARRERDEAKAEAKEAKELEKAAIKFGKKLDKVRKEFEKYRDKSATEDERGFWQALLDFLPVPNEEE